MFEKRWQISSSLTTQHLLSVISIANTMMELPHACFKSVAKPNTNEATDSDDHRRRIDSMEQSQVRHVLLF